MAVLLKRAAYWAEDTGTVFPGTKNPTLGIRILHEEFQGLENKAKPEGTGSEMDQAVRLFLFMTIRTSALATLVVRHFSLTPFLDGTHVFS